MSNNKNEESLKGKLKIELGYIKEGAKVLPKVVVKKGKEWIKKQVQAAKESAELEREIEAAAKAAEKDAYKAEAIKQAKIRGIERAKKRKAGWREQLQEVGAIGDRLSVSKIVGLETEKAEKESENVVRRAEVDGLADISVSDFLFSGLREKKKKKE